MNRLVKTSPDYVDYPGSPTMPGPIDFADATISSFPLLADVATLRALCEAQIAEPSGGKVTFDPLPMVVMSFNEFPHSTFAGLEGRGFASERELSFGIPGIYSCFAGSLPEIGFAVYMPFMFLDNPVAILTGREEYGFFKQAGVIGLPGDKPEAQGYAADAYGAAAFAPSTRWDWQRLLTLTPAASAANPQRGWQSQDVAAQAMVADLSVRFDGAGAGPPSLDLFQSLLSGQLPQLFLKQFRDIADGSEACYQALALASYQVTGFGGIDFLPTYDIVLNHLDSAPVASALGLGSPTSTEIGMKIKVDMRLEQGRVLWLA